MGAKQNVEAVEDYRAAIEDGDWDRVAELLAPDVRMRMAGVPRALGGVTEGAESAIAFMRANTGGGRLEVLDQIADDRHVCLTTKMQAERFPGNEFLKGAGKPYTTHQCTIYRFANGRISEIDTYVNWLDVYAQVGLVDVGKLASG